MTLLLPVALAVAAEDPATVLDHQVTIRVDGARRSTQSVVWTVRVDDPAACAAGVLAPPGLDGAADRGAVVLEDLLVVPSDAPAGTVFTLKATTTEGPGGHSGVFLSAPDLPTERASIVVEVPTTSPLTVWADPNALPTFDVRAARRVEFRWSALPRGTPAQAAWSTWTDWLDAAQRIGATVDGKLATKEALGQPVAGDIGGLGLAGIAERATETVALEAGPPGTWTTARSALEVVRSRSGNAAERGIVLIALLRIAGFDAVPAYYRPNAAHGSFPITVPAPTLLPRPVVVIRREDGPVYVDPAAVRAAVPDRPASMLGATVWVPGELPVRLSDPGVVDGQVAVNTTLTISGEGSTAFNLQVQATGAAQEYLRDLLAPLDEAGRTEAFTRLLSQGRPGISRVSVSISGAEDPNRRLKITVSGQQDGVLQAVEYGLRGTIAPTLAPAMAAWLPPRIAVVEEVAIAPPQAVQILGTSLEPSAYRGEATIGRTLAREGPKAVLTVEVERPYRRSTPAVDAAASAFLASEAQKGVELLLFTAASTTAVKGLRATPELSPADRAVLEALLWYHNTEDGKAEKALKKAEPLVGFEPLVAGLQKWSDPSDLRPWEGLALVAALDDGRRIRVAEGLEAAGARRPAWVAAHALCGSADPDVRVRALLLAERVQGPQPDAAKDPEGAAMWRPPLELMIAAQKAAAELPGATPGADPRVVFRLAELSLEQDDLAGAEALLEKVERTALAEAMLADTAAASGVPIDEIRARVLAAVAKDPQDPQVLSVAADALSRVGDAPGALEMALTAARLAHDDPDLWSLVIEGALGAGDLALAVKAAEEASDLDPENRARAERWATLATALLDREAVDAARVRAGMPTIAGWPPSIDDRMALDEGALAAVLEHEEERVVGDPRLLSMRAQLRIQTKRLDDAARDALLLATRHGEAEGWALAFAATAGRQYSTAALARLDEAVRTELTAQTTRMEYRLVTGSGDPLEDARRLGDDPRAEALLRSATKPAEAAAAIQGWPAQIPQPTQRPPPGFRANRALSAPGVVGFSNAEAAVAFARVGAVTGLVPPPVGLLYTAHPQAVQRLEGGGQVLRLDGGVMPVFAAVAVDGAQEVWGYGFTAESAKQALTAGLGR